MVLLGPPGAGKGTQAKLAAKRLGLKHIASGDLFRGQTNVGSDLGKEAQWYMTQGMLVPDGLAISIALKELNSKDPEVGVILDGFPRNLNQAKKLDDMLEGNGGKIDVVLLIMVPEAELLNRMQGRRVCTECQSAFHVFYSPPKSAGQCDFCGGALYQREDDDEKTTRKRLNVYESETSVLRKYYRQQSKLVEVDGTGDIEDVSQRLFKELTDLDSAQTVKV
ncbi:adenylate kinase [SAR202 cluster bacterium AD-804-J14_MRT_500m]|nr:adenylate kinase [SAR202 cluster bacterium AD-804-J14_MRT_500m]